MYLTLSEHPAEHVYQYPDNGARRSTSAANDEEAKLLMIIGTMESIFASAVAR